MAVSPSNASTTTMVDDATVRPFRLDYYDKFAEWTDSPGRTS
jgi:hypothetical protein